MSIYFEIATWGRKEPFKTTWSVGNRVTNAESRGIVIIVTYSLRRGEKVGHYQ